MRTEQDSTPAAEAGSKGVASIGSRWMSVGVVALTVGVMIATILLSMSKLRERVRNAVFEQDVVLLQAATASAVGKAGAESAQDRIGQLRDLFGGLMDASNIREEDVFAVRLFDEKGKFVISMPADLLPTDLTLDMFGKMEAGDPSGQYEAKFDVNSRFRPEFRDRMGKIVAPVLIATVPLKNATGKFIGAAEFLLSAARMQSQLEQVDREVQFSALSFSLGGGSIVLLILSWAFSRLNRANTLLAERTANLLRANHELTMAAKTSAVGAVAAHLIHGLKNPLFGLQAFVAVKSETAQEGEWKAAIDSTKRMQSMIADVVRILREEAGESAYEVSVGELISILEGKVMPTAKEASVKFEASGDVKGALPNREANLVILALTNLIQNAIQASKTGTKVRLLVSENETCVCFDVMDEAGGLPAMMQKNLFMPCQSSKVGGTGLGLAISKQLANQMGGQLELVRTDTKGTNFRLTIPRQLFSGTRNGAVKEILQAENVVA